MEKQSDMNTFSPPDLYRINELIKQSQMRNGDSTELAKLVEDGIRYWEQQDKNNLTAEQHRAFDSFNQMHKYIAQHQLKGVDKALYS